MKKLHHKESDLQIRCVKWFRIQYPAYARLMEHPKNEGHGDRVSGAIAKAEGVQAGVADLILHLPSIQNTVKGEIQEEPYTFHSLAVEMKDKRGSQSREQKVWQRLFEAAGGLYEVVRDFDDFVAKVEAYVDGVPSYIDIAVHDAWREIEAETTEAARRELKRIINK